MQTLAVTLAEASFLSHWIWPILQFVVGLGLVIFVHELGHFLVAKAVGIKVERFALGFGPRLIGFQWGETDYCIKALPLGGYIKMLGQEDLRPANEVEDLDPRSYNAKPVWARLCVISAGVVMNVILAAVLFVLVVMIGMDSPAAVVGAVKKHFPASQAVIAWHSGPTSRPGGSAGGAATTQPVVTTGLEPGDRIVRIDGESMILSVIGNRIDRFGRIALLAVTSDGDDEYTMTVQREVGGATWEGTTRLGVRMGATDMGGEMYSFGIASAHDTTIDKGGAGEWLTDERLDVFEDGDRVVSVAGRAVRHYWQIGEILQGASAPAVDVVVRRGEKDVALRVPVWLNVAKPLVFLKDGTKINEEDYRTGEGEGDAIELTHLADGSRRTLEPNDVIRPEPLDLLGMSPALVVVAVEKGSAAEEAGLKAGDVVVHYGDHPLPTLARILETSRKVGEKGTRIAVRRDGRTLEVFDVIPRKEKGQWIVGMQNSPHLADTVVAGVRPGSPAARAGLESGCVIDKVNDRPVKSWLEVFEALKALRGREVTLAYRRSDRPEAETRTAAIGVLDESAFDPDDYRRMLYMPAGRFRPLLVTLRREGIGEALGWSVRETGGFMLTTYASLRALIKGNVSTKGVFGPVGMGDLAISTARTSSINLIYLMAYFSAIIAVLNFLPLPVVDGGHAVFLIIEKIRGRPVSVKVMNIVQMVGLVLLLGVFVAVTFQDIMRLITS